MSDITDQDRRAARSWAKNWQGDLDDDTSAAARVILATVDAPEPALSEELVHIAVHWEEWATDTITEELTAATTRAELMEHDLAEARADVEQLTEALKQLSERVTVRYEPKEK